MDRHCRILHCGLRTERSPQLFPALEHQRLRCAACASGAEPNAGSEGKLGYCLIAQLPKCATYDVRLLAC